MQVFHGLDQIPAGFGPTVASIGNFDGVHLGHRKILDAVTTAARSTGARAVAITFDPHPLRLLKPEAAPQVLTPTEAKLRLLDRAGIDAVVVLPFTETLSRLSAREFVQRLLVDRLSVTALHEGTNFRCGHRAEAGVAELSELGAKLGFAVMAHQPVLVRGMPVSSSRIRTRLQAGAVNSARRMLGRWFSVRSHPARGRGIGSRLLAPTINLADYAAMLPATGVYATRLAVGDGEDGCARRSFDAVTNVGWRPTVGTPSFAVETHILDFEPIELDEETPLELEFHCWLRPEIHWPDMASLRAQIAHDVRRAQRYFLRAKPLAAAADDL
jgi:riboflavin kinase/FMN adenylyltransferase